MKGTGRRAAAWLLAAAMVLGGPAPRSYGDSRGGNSTIEGGGICKHHPKHTEECGYREETPGTPCGHVQTEECCGEDLVCGFASPSDAETATGSNGKLPHQHTRECYGLVCPHEKGINDEGCGYRKAAAGAGCQYQCGICAAQGQVFQKAARAGETEEVTYLDENGEEKSVQAAVVGETMKQWGETGTTSWYVIPSMELIMDSRVTVKGDVRLILADGCDFKADYGISVTEGDSLTIHAQSTEEERMGRLTAKGYEQQAGIGGDQGKNGGTVAITGGFITATGGVRGAGIGGGSGGAGGIVTITGGSVTATGWRGGAGIGGGDNYGNGGIVTITGGSVTARGLLGGAGIGGGNYGNGGIVTITGGSVTAEGSDGGAGIGGGPSGYGGIATIAGGEVTAAGYCLNGSTDSIGPGDGAYKGGILFTEDPENPGKLKGIVQGDFVTPEKLEVTVPENATLVIPAGVTLTIGGTFRNSGVIQVEGTLSVGNETIGRDKAKFISSGTINIAGKCNVWGLYISDGENKTGARGKTVSFFPYLRLKGDRIPKGSSVAVTIFFYSVSLDHHRRKRYC